MLKKIKKFFKKSWGKLERKEKNIIEKDDATLQAENHHIKRKEIVLDFKDVKEKQDILDIFQKGFHFAFHPKNYDSLADSISSLDTESDVYIKNEGLIKITVKNLKSIKNISQRDYDIISEILKENNIDFKA